MTVGGSTLAAHAFNAGLIDECQPFMYPVLVGKGKPAFSAQAVVAALGRKVSHRPGVRRLLQHGERRARYGTAAACQIRSGAASGPCPRCSACLFGRP
ncbi:MAG: dihydrofolate reductase family protein [Acidimicrobiales bacterium]